MHLHKLVPDYAKPRLSKNLQLFADLLGSLKHFVESGLESPEFVPNGLLSPAPRSESTCLRDLNRNFDSKEIFNEIKRGLDKLFDHWSKFQHVVMTDVLNDLAGFGSDVLLVRKGDKRLRKHR